MTERRACRLANQPRGTQRYRTIRREDEDALTHAIVQLAGQYGRYGYRRITALLERAGWREHTRESLLVRAERRWSSSRVISALAVVMVMKDVPEHLRSKAEIHVCSFVFSLELTLAIARGTIHSRY